MTKSNNSRWQCITEGRQGRSLTQELESRSACYSTQHYLQPSQRCTAGLMENAASQVVHKPANTQLTFSCSSVPPAYEWCFQQWAKPSYINQQSRYSYSSQVHWPMWFRKFLSWDPHLRQFLLVTHWNLKLTITATDVYLCRVTGIVHHIPPTTSVKWVLESQANFELSV